MNINRLKAMAERHPLLRVGLSPLIAIRRHFIHQRLRLKKEVLDDIAELLHSDPVIRVDEFGGVFAVAAHSDIFTRILTDKSYEPALVRCCQRYADRSRDIIDIGANIGLFSVMFAKHTNQRVLSIEPTSNALRRLRQNLELNGVTDKVEIFAGVASNESGDVEIKTIMGKEEYSSLGKMEHPAIAQEEYTTEKVTAKTLDQLVAEKTLNPGFIKVDVEGAEHLVFGGAQNVLKEKRPVILSELCDYLLRKNGSSAADVIGMIRQHEYDVYDPLEPSKPPGSGDFGDVICFPNEMAVSVEKLANPFPS